MSGLPDEPLSAITVSIVLSSFSSATWLAARVGVGVSDWGWGWGWGWGWD